MKVRKNDGRIQSFDLAKITLILERISDDYSQPFTKSDLTSVTKNIEHTIENTIKDTIKSEPIIDTSQIRAIVIGELEKAGFKQISKLYAEYMKDFR